MTFLRVEKEVTSRQIDEQQEEEEEEAEESDEVTGAQMKIKDTLNLFFFILSLFFLPSLV